MNTDTHHTHHSPSTPPQSKVAAPAPTATTATNRLQPETGIPLTELLELCEDSRAVGDSFWMAYGRGQITEHRYNQWEQLDQAIQKCINCQGGMKQQECINQDKSTIGGQ